MKKLIFIVTIFVVLNMAVFSLGLSELESDIGRSIFSGYHAHFLAFFIMSLLLSLILTHKMVSMQEPFMFSFLYALLVAVLIEVLQMQLAYRSFSVYDIFAAIGGAGIYWLIGHHAAKNGFFKFWNNSIHKSL